MFLVLSIMWACGLEMWERYLHRGYFYILLKIRKVYLGRTGDGICDIDKAVVLHASPQHRREDIQIYRRNAEFHWSFLTASG